MSRNGATTEMIVKCIYTKSFDFISAHWTDIYVTNPILLECDRLCFVLRQQFILTEGDEHNDMILFVDFQRNSSPVLVKKKTKNGNWHH